MNLFMKPPLLKGIQRDFPPNCELFLYVKIKNRDFGKTLKT